MPFIEKIEGLKSLAIVGTAKNTGKTETLNYLLRRWKEKKPSKDIGVTSIGIDGERRDLVTHTEKPEIILDDRMLFVTAEQFYRLKRLPAEVLEVERGYTTSIGKLILSRAKGRGKAMIAGPSTTGGLRKIVERMRFWGAELSIIDGALSRLSLASPTVAEGMILATGASFSAQPEKLIQRTKELYQLIELPQLENRALALELEGKDQGIYIITLKNEVIDSGFTSALLPDLWKDISWMEKGGALFVPGVVNDRLLDKLRLVSGFDRLIVKDFTRIFCSGRAIRNYFSAGKEIMCLNKAKLIALTFNPQSTSGYSLNSEDMCQRLQDAIDIPVYDVRKI